MKYDKIIKVCKFLSEVKPGSVILWGEKVNPYLVTNIKTNAFISVVRLDNGELRDLAYEREVEVIEHAS